MLRSQPRDGPTRCPLCRESGTTTACAGCGTEYHASCLAELGGCSTLGCRESGRVAPLDSKPDEVPVPPRSLLVKALFAALIPLLMVAAFFADVVARRQAPPGSKPLGEARLEPEPLVPLPLAPVEREVVPPSTDAVRAAVERGREALLAGDAGAALEAGYDALSASPGLEAKMSQPGLPRADRRSQLAEERLVQDARAALARGVVAPAGAVVRTIPRSDPRPSVDGRVDPDEWRGALRLDVRTSAAGGQPTWLHLRTDGTWLFIGCEATGEATAVGFDQLRFYFHVGVHRLLKNERVHLGGSADVLRDSSARWTGPLPRDGPESTDRERWKAYDLCEWYVQPSAVGTSAMVGGHRHYEAALLLEEAGLHPGAPFAAYVEVETDPINDADGRFVRREHLGELGAQHAPVWFVLAPP